MKTKVGYSGLHRWMTRKYGNPKSCEHCGAIGKKNGRSWSIHWANRTGRYLRDRSDWIALCSKCHAVHDKKRGLIGKEKKMPKRITMRYPNRNMTKVNWRFRIPYSKLCNDCKSVIDAEKRIQRRVANRQFMHDVRVKSKGSTQA